MGGRERQEDVVRIVAAGRADELASTGLSVVTILSSEYGREDGWLSAYRGVPGSCKQGQSCGCRLHGEWVGSWHREPELRFNPSWSDIQSFIIEFMFEPIAVDLVSLGIGCPGQDLMRQRPVADLADAELH
jgi:hypothetical protein